MIPETSNASNEPRISLRPEHEKDEAFLLTVYAGTRAEDLALAGWNDATCRQFIEMQFKAMRHGYATSFPQAEFLIILLKGHPIGRAVVNRTEREIRIVDMALLPEHRGKGIGTELMQIWRAEALKSGKPLRLRVVRGTRPASWYQRLGFVPVDNNDDGVHDHLEFTGQAAPAIVSKTIDS